MSTAQIVFQGIIAIVAVLGFILSCYSLYLHRRDKRPDLRLSTETKLVTDNRRRRSVLTISVANGGPIPLQIVAVYCGLKKAPKMLRIADLEGEPEPPFRLGVGDSVSWDTDHDELSNALSKQLRREQLMPDADDLGNWVPDDPTEITEPRRFEPPSRKVLMVETLRATIVSVFERVMLRSSSFERFIRTNPLIGRVLFGAPLVAIVITAEDGLGNLYTETAWYE